MKNFKNLSAVVTILFLTFFSATLMAQPGDPGDPGDNPVPITGVEILLLAGGALGGYKFIKNRNQKDENETL